MPEVARRGVRPRRGVVLVVVLICLALATVLFLLVVRQAAAEHKAMEMAQWELQASWLAEAGVERAAARLAADAKYAGETWTISSKELAGDDAVVRIHVETIADQPERRTVRVEADYPNANEVRARRSKQVLVDRETLKSMKPTETKK